MGKNLENEILKAKQKIEQKDISGALLIYQNILNQDPQSYPSLIALAKIYLEQKQWENSLECFQKAYNLQPSAEILQNIGVMYYKKGEFLKSLEYYEQAEKMGRPIFEIYLNKALTYEKLKKPKEAAEFFLKAYEIEPKREICLKLAPICLESKMFEQAVHFYKIIIDYEENPFYYAELGLAYSQLGNFSEAEKCYQKAKELTKHSKKYPKLEKLTFEDLVKKYPNIPKQMEEKKQIIASGKADYTDLVDLGTMHFIQENYEESLAVYEKARNEFLYQLIFKL